MSDPIPSTRRDKLGLPPGTPVFIGDQILENARVSYFQYNDTDLEENQIQNPLKEFPELKDDYITWLNIVGIHDTDLINTIGEIMDIDPIILEYIADTSARPRIEDLGNYFFFIIKDLYFDAELTELNHEHFAFIVGNNYLITFQEDEKDHFGTIRERLRKHVGKLRSSGVDYLFNRLLDLMVDNYYIVVEDMGEQIDALEDVVIVDPSRDTLQMIQDLKSQLIYTRRLILPIRELVGIMTKLDHIVISDNTLVFVRSIYDHLNQIIDSVEIYREMLIGFLEIYLSSISNKTNDVMKVLTIVTSVFIPLSFLAGVFGMNFAYMPELRIWWAYPLVWMLFILISGGMLYYFKRLGWLSLE